MSTGESFVWSNNNASNLIWSESEAPSGYWRLPRERKLEENNGDVGNLTLSVLLADLPVTTEDVLLMVDADGDFSS
ncbi:MAG: hypothetical protein H6765_01310 [Candidatus Peribacteria bacterium]|nr:MAG: hypothetical protein H6765_01310 [Candidatus Peribacteria bacterium]